MKQELEDYKAYQRAVSEVDTLAPLIRAYNYYTCLCAHNTLLGRVAEAVEADEQLDIDAKDTQVCYRSLVWISRRMGTRCYSSEFGEGSKAETRVFP